MHIFSVLFLFVYALQQMRSFMHIFVNSVERLNSPVYSAPPCIFYLALFPSYHAVLVKYSVSSGGTFI